MGFRGYTIARYCGWCLTSDNDSSVLAFGIQKIIGTSQRPTVVHSDWGFTSQANPKYFLFHPSHQIFRRMHEALNVGKKDN
jgi:hypothetical protein